MELSEHSNQLLTSFYLDYFEPLFLRGRSDRTRSLYGTTMRNFSKHLGRPGRLSDLNDATVNRFLDWFRRLPRAAASTNKERTNLLAMWRFACRKGFLTTWPDVKPDVEPERVPQAWLADDIARLMAAIEKQTHAIAGVPASLWWSALHLVCWDTGERIGAVRDLRWHHADLRGGYLLVPAEDRKGGRRDRLYKLAPDTVAALKDLRPRTQQFIFPWPYSRTYLWNRYDKILKAAGLPTDRKSKFHRIRRSVASHAEAAGGNATELLDHSSRSVTLKYLDPRIVPQQNAVDLLFRPGEQA